MTDLIKIEAREIAGVSVQTVNARELWAFVESKQDFSTWIKARIDKFGFIEGADFTVHKFMDSGSRGQFTTDYHLTVDMGKELAMVENNDKGREVRRYFIECEKRAQTIQPAFAIPQTFTEALRLAADLAEGKARAELEVAQQQKLLEVAAPKVQAFDRIALSDGSLCITDAAKTLQIQPRKLTQLLQEHHWTYRRPMGAGWLAYQDRIQQGLMEHKVTIGEKGDGREWSNTQARITPKGLTKLAEVVRQAGQL